MASDTVRYEEFSLVKIFMVPFGLDIGLVKNVIKSCG